MTVLEELWYGNIDPHESFLIKNQQFRHLLSLMGRNRENLTDTLTDLQKELLEKYDDTINETHALAEQAAFRYGFALGMRLMVESIAVELMEDEE